MNEIISEYPSLLLDVADKSITTSTSSSVCLEWHVQSTMCDVRCLASEDEKANESKAGETKEKKKKKKKNDKKRTMAVKKEPGEAIIAKLRLADNGIDGLHTSDANNRAALIDFLQLCRSSVNYLRLCEVICETHNRAKSSFQYFSSAKPQHNGWHEWVSK